jgi:LDH2 family malate/lactate/ureidoglycolate dehydrogenase
MNTNVLVNTKELNFFTKKVLIHAGLSNKDAQITTNVLLSRDKRGISSHGVVRLKRYLDAIKTESLFQMLLMK